MLSIITLLAGCLIMILAGLQPAYLRCAHWLALLVMGAGLLGLFTTRSTRDPADCFTV